MIEVTSLTKRFDEVVAVDNLSLTFSEGITGLVGVNGSGKSTLLRTIAGIYLPNEGTVQVDGIDASIPEAKRNVFFLSDNPFCGRGANIDGVLDLYKGLFEVDEMEFHRLIDNFGLPKNRSVSNFSKGMRRQVFVALALSMKAKHLLLDEAFDGLDPLVVDSIKGEVIDAAARGKTVIISSHNIFALQRLVDRFVILSSGKVAKEEESDKMADEFLKFQAAFKSRVIKEDIESLGIEVISFRMVGSVTHFVIRNSEEAARRIQEKFEAIFIDTVPLEPEEVVTLEMSLAKKGDR